MDKRGKNEAQATPDDSMRTETVLSEIRDHFGFIPPFFAIVQSIPPVLGSLWQQAQAADIHNPLPALFKEKLFIRLSHHSHMPYDLRGHCVALHTLGMEGEEIVTFLQKPHPDERQIEEHLGHLKGIRNQLSSWPEAGTLLEMVLFTCICHMFLQRHRAEACRSELQRLLGTHYLYLVAFLSYVRTCHHWIEASVETLPESDETMIAHFESAFSEEQVLKDFLHERHQKVWQKRLQDAEQRYTQIEERQEREEHTQQLLDALLSIAELLVLGPDESMPEPLQEYVAPAITPTVQKLQELTRSVLGCERIGIMTVDPVTELIHPVALVGFSPEQEKHWWEQTPGTRLADRLGDPQLSARIQQGEALVLDKRKPPFNEQQNSAGAGSWLLAPMNIKGHTVGLLALDYGDVEHGYSTKEKDFALAIARLMALIFERNHLLRERTYAQAHALALQDANRRMNDFLGVAAHELKTPTTTIKGSMQILLRQMQHVEQHDYSSKQEYTHARETMHRLLMRADNQANRLTRLINDMIYVSRIQSNKLVLRLERCDLVEVVREVASQQSQLTPNRLIELDLPDEHIPVMIDKDHIEQVITNYLSNALKYSEKTKPVTISLQHVGTQVRISIRDYGPGLAYIDQEYIWERFYRVQGTEVRSGSGIGLGLGLYISRSIIEEHGGHVGVHSAPGEGAMFWFTLQSAPS